MQSRGHQFLRMLPRTHLSFTAEFMRAKARADAGVCPQAEPEEKSWRAPTSMEKNKFAPNATAMWPNPEQR